GPRSRHRPRRRPVPSARARDARAQGGDRQAGVARVGGRQPPAGARPRDRRRRRPARPLADLRLPPRRAARRARRDHAVGGGRRRPRPTPLHRCRRGSPPAEPRRL
ncbi:MAG: hypothetical protein AVDCRST_MAG85-255, partial [uncultured Solirubrobacteraceae bacterium]